MALATRMVGILESRRRFHTASAKSGHLPIMAQLVNRIERSKTYTAKWTARKSCGRARHCAFRKTGIHCRVKPMKCIGNSIFGIPVASRKTYNSRR